MELYKKHRPKTLDRMVGVKQTARALGEMVQRGKLPHAILFHGPSGCGKTTLVRIMKTMLACHDMDYREVNSSSFRGIDTIRDIQRQMSLSPCAGPCRIWALDEVHKLSNDAQNAALKILEDTPAHVYFFLCTTEPERLIKAIRTRCSEMLVSLLTEDELEGLLERVCKKEKIELAKDVRDELVASAQGSARTALVLLDKIANLDADEQKAAIAEKLAEENEAIDLCRALIDKAPWKEVAKIVSNIKGDPEQVRYAVMGYARAVLLKKDSWQAYNVLQTFSKNFYDSKAAGLVLAAYEAINLKE